MAQLKPHQTTDVVIEAGDVFLPGMLTLPEGAGSVVVFAQWFKRFLKPT